MTTFNDLGLAESLLRALADEGYSAATEIQLQAIPHVLAGRDLLACAQTGTGKTAAFALPLIHRLRLAAPKSRGVRVVVLAPTRELASQIQDSFRAYGRHAAIRTTAIYGGVSQRPQVDALRRGVEVLVATPGRLLDLIGQRLVDLRQVEALVLDEADRMLDMGFVRDVRRIVATLPSQRQTLLFSATLSTSIRELAADMLDRPLEVQVARQSIAATTIDQAVYLVEKNRKRRLLVHLLNNTPMGRVLVFTQTKHAADRLQRELCKAGVRAAAIHGNKSQANRERTLREFRSNSPPVLVATDVASRGLDVDMVSHVVNYDLPREPETYVHRIGRTGRAGEAGIAVSFCDSAERQQLRAIERLIRQAIPVKQEKLPEEPNGGEQRGDSHEPPPRQATSRRSDQPSRRGDATSSNGGATVTKQRERRRGGSPGSTAARGSQTSRYRRFG